MADFFQNGSITTLHNLTHRTLEDLEADLNRFKKNRPLMLMIPSLYSELQRPALAHIKEHLKEVSYLDHLVIGLDQATEKEYRHAVQYFSDMPFKTTVIWNHGPRMLALHQQLFEHGLAPKEEGKGKNVWYSFGFVLSQSSDAVVALHDADITTYSREMLARLFYPIAHPQFGFYFAKGFYPRWADGKLNGRVCRLLVTPLVRALQNVIGYLPYLGYIDSFRYPLAGEFAMRTSVMKDVRIPSDWGLEIGILTEMQRTFSTHRICQVDLADKYDHKHQKLSADDHSQGLSKMATDISKAIFRKLATYGVVLSTETFRTVKAMYYRMALDMVESYRKDALFNGLNYQTHGEEEAVELFAATVMEAGTTFLDNPMETPFIPCWRRVISAIPDFFELMHEAVRQDTLAFGGVDCSSLQLDDLRSNF